MVKMIKKEEEFLDEFGDVAIVAANFLDREWEPNYFADDSYRSNLEYFFSQGDIADLVFDGAAIYHMGYQFSSVQILLKSSLRSVTVKVKLEGEKLIAEKIVDRPLKQLKNTG